MPRGWQPHVVRATLLLAALHLSATSRGQIQPAPRQLLVTGKNVIFFEPTRAERDSIVRTEGLEMAELFDDFSYYAGKASVYLNSLKIPVVFTSDTLIVVQLQEGRIRAFERKKVADYCGVILTDGMQDPRLVLGVVTDEELIPTLKDFFQLK